MAKPFIKGYKNDEELQTDIEKLKSQNVGENDIYVISHDDERTKRIAKNVEINTIGANEMGIGDAVKGAFDKKGDQLRKQLENIGFSETEAEKYESEMDKGTVFLIVTRTDNVDTILAQ
ncbi:MAG TPA: general stress protein [Candidatus Salinicoccus merdavium]|nr:general stress protein [Candidatus Salinicoccus merdavium]